MNRNQCTFDYWRGQELQVVPSHYSLIRCLRDMGWEVEQREVELGEDISGYDEVIFFVHNAQGFAHCLYTGLYAISKRPDAILAFDDWQVRDIFHALERLQEFDAEDREDRIIKQYIMDIQTKKRSKEELQKYRADFIAGTRVVTERKNRLLISAFEGGDISLLRLDWPLHRTFTYNPNPYHYNRTPDNDFGSTDPLFSMSWSRLDFTEKKREWNFASLLHDKTKTWLKRQNPQWPVEMFGQRKGENRTARVTEDAMCLKYHEQWGCLMPGYAHAGSGWWRARPLQVADAGSVLVCDDKEGAVFGEAYVGVRVSDVEQMDAEQLAHLAARQKECLYDNHPIDRAHQRDQIRSVLDAPK